MSKEQYIRKSTLEKIEEESDYDDPNINWN